MYSRRWIGLAFFILAALIAMWLIASLASRPACACEPEHDGASRCVPARRPFATPVPTPRPLTVQPSGPAASAGILPFTYAYVITGPVPLYASPEAIAAGTPARSLARGYVWVRIGKSVTIGDQKYYQIANGTFISAAALAFIRPSAFTGVVNPTNLPFGWILANTGVSTAAGAAPAKDAPTVSRYQVVQVYEEQVIDAVRWYRIGENQWVAQKHIAVVQPSPRPHQIGADEQWIEVNLSQQTLMAYEGDRMVYATLISSGLPRWSTIKGLFRAWAKVRSGTMYGAEGKADYYYLEDVPWTIYFHDDFAIHAAYWHDRFGAPHSHGCVNVPPLAAKWIFEWANPPLAEKQNVVYTKGDTPGIWVWVHE